MYVCKGHKNLSKRVFTNFSHYPIEITRILNEVKTAIQKTNLDYNIVIKRLHLYYSMKLVTFVTDKDRSLLIQHLMLLIDSTI